MAGQKPRQGWIYMVDPYRVSLRCAAGHSHVYNLTEPGEVECQTSSCSRPINSSRVFRGTHPYLVWTSDDFHSETSYIQTFIAIPLTSQTTFLGLPTTYPIDVNSKNGLLNKSYALIHQICTIDANCFKDRNGDWLTKMGILNTKDRENIKERLSYVLNISTNPSEDWFQKNASPELLKKIFGYLPDAIKPETLERLLDDLE